MITSPANKKVKEVRALFDKASLRAERGLFPIEGVRMFLEAPAAEIEELYVSESFAARAEGEVRKKIEALKAETVADNIFAKMSDTKTPQGVLALVRMQRKSLEEVLKGGASCFLRSRACRTREISEPCFARARARVSPRYSQTAVRWMSTIRSWFARPWAAYSAFRWSMSTTFGRHS